MLSNLKNANEYRGYLINEFANLEIALDKHILSNFISLTDYPNVYEMREVVLDRMTFDGKRTAVKGILDKKSTKNGFVKTKNNSFPNGKLFDEVRQLSEIRNQFAHYRSVDDFGEYAISLVLYRDSFKILRYSHEDFVDFIKRITDATNSVLSLLPDGAGL